MEAKKKEDPILVARSLFALGTLGLGQACLMDESWIYRLFLSGRTQRVLRFFIQGFSVRILLEHINFYTFDAVA